MLLVSLLVDLLLEVETTSLSRLDKGHEQVPTLEQDLGSCLLGCSCGLTVGEADEAHAGLRQHLDVVHVAKLLEETLELLVSGAWVDVLDDQVEIHHRLFPLVSLLGDFSLALLLRLGLANEQATLNLVSQLAVVIERLLGVLPIGEADEAKATRLSFVVLHHASAQNIAELFEQLQ